MYVLSGCTACGPKRTSDRAGQESPGVLDDQMHDALLKAVVVHLIAHRPRHETRSDAAPTALTSSVVASVHLIVATKKIR